MGGLGKAHEIKNARELYFLSKYIILVSDQVESALMDVFKYCVKKPPVGIADGAVSGNFSKIKCNLLLIFIVCHLFAFGSNLESKWLMVINCAK